MLVEFFPMIGFFTSRWAHLCSSGILQSMDMFFLQNSTGKNVMYSWVDRCMHFLKRHICFLFLNLVSSPYTIIFQCICNNNNIFVRLLLKKSRYYTVKCMCNLNNKSHEFFCQAWLEPGGLIIEVGLHESSYPSRRMFYQRKRIYCVGELVLFGVFLDLWRCNMYSTLEARIYLLHP